MAELVTAYVDGELEPAERERIRAHIGDCPRCREQAQDERVLRLILKSLPLPPLPERLRISGN